LGFRYSLEDRLAVVDKAEALEMENEELRNKLNDTLRLLEEKEQQINFIKGKKIAVFFWKNTDRFDLGSQLEILQALAVLKQNTRAFQNGILKIVDGLPPKQAAGELSKMVKREKNSFGYR
jgi:hypothetical protein